MAKRTSQAVKPRNNYSDLVQRAQKGERSVVRQRNRRIAAVVPIEDLDFLEALEDRLDIEEARKRLNESTVPWEQVKKELGL